MADIEQSGCEPRDNVKIRKTRCVAAENHPNFAENHPKSSYEVGVLSHDATFASLHSHIYFM